VDRKATSVPATPIDAPVLPSAPMTSDILPKRMSTPSPAGPFMSTPSPTPKREKRGSLLNRLVKKFSTLKRGSEPILGGIEGWNYEASSTAIHPVKPLLLLQIPTPSQKSLIPLEIDQRKISQFIPGKKTIVPRSLLWKYLTPSWAN
jgi:hypothetical protein